MMHYGPLQHGTWWLRSKKDPLWDANGEGTVGMFQMPKLAALHIEDMKKKLNKEPPEDLEFGYMKD